jgi:hypothetical protein
VDLGHLAGVLIPQGSAPVDQDPQHSQLLVADHRTEAAHPGADQRDGVSIGGVGLATLPSDEDPCSSRQFGQDVDNGLAFGQEPVGHVPAGALAALDGPDAIRPLLDVAAHRLESFTVVPNRPLPRMDSSLVMTSIATERLCGSIPMTIRGVASFMVFRTRT